MLAAGLAASLLIASPAMAQSLADQVSVELAANGLSLDTASEADIAAATEAVFDRAIEDQLALVGLDPATATDEQIAQAVGALMNNNPGLSDGAVADLTEQQATAIVRAAVRARPGAVVRIAAAAAYARPALALAFQNAANSVAPGQEEEVAAAVTRSASQGTTDDLNDDGVVDEEEDPSVT